MCHLLLKNKKGFTLVELMMTTVIIAILTTLIVINYRAGESQLALERSVAKLAQDIRRSQEMAMSASEYLPGQIPEGGYGISIEASSSNPPPYIEKYILFADIYQSSSHKYNSGNDYLIGQIQLEEGVMIKSIATDLGAKTKIDIVFTPPDPKIYITPDAGTPIWSKITLALKGDLTKTRTITVNKAGLIEL